MAKNIEHKILITGFEPFDGAVMNASWEAVKLLPEEISGWKILKLEIPTVFGKAGDAVIAAVKEQTPDAVICIGQASGSQGIRLERVAVNLKDARIPDNEGCQPVDEPVISGGPDAYLTRLPVRKMYERLQACNIPVELSLTAGTYVCNSVMYSLLHLINRKYKKIRGGFIHVPDLPAQAQDTADVSTGQCTEQPAMPAEQTSDALRICVEVLIEELNQDKDKNKKKDTDSAESKKEISDTSAKEKSAKAKKEKADKPKKEKKEKTGPNVLDKSAELVRNNAPKVKREMKKLAENPVVRDVALEALEVAKDGIRNRKIRRIAGVALRAARIPSSVKSDKSNQ